MKENWFYLWYSIVLCFPPMHELGHILIAWCCGYGVSDLYWDHVVYSGYVQYGFLQEWWQYSIWVPLFCAFLFLFLVLKDVRIVKNRKYVRSRLYEES